LLKYIVIHAILVGGFNPEKYERQLGLLFPIYKKKMLETTNQNNIMLKHKTTDTTRYSNWDIFHPLISGVSE
jgi:hypothetical protein